MGIMFRRIHGFLRFARREFSEHPASPAAHLDALLRRKHSHSLAVMDPEVRRTRTYIPATLFRRRQRYHSWRTAEFFRSKLTQQLWFDRYCPENAPPTLYYVGLNGLEPVARSAKSLPFIDLPNVLREHGVLFVKPANGGHGYGIAHLARRDDNVEINTAPISDEALVRMAREQWQGHLVSKAIPNSEWSGKFYDRTLNTLRVLTGVHRDTYTPVILSAIFKIGRDATFPTDNWQRGLGGLTAKVDLETGRLGAALSYAPGKGGGRRSLSAHPESGATIEGEVVPDWPAVKQLLVDLVCRLSFFGPIGWDVALTPTGAVIVEGNGTPGLDIHEAHESLLATEEQRACFAGMRIYSKGLNR